MAKRPSKKLEGSSIVWDNAAIEEPAVGYCIQATPLEFEAVATYLLSSVAIRYPDPSKLDSLEIENFNEFLRNAAQRIALQMLTLMTACGLVDNPMRLRQKAGNPCVWQQEQSEGVWVDIFDMSLCMSEMVDTIVDEIGDKVDEKETIRDLKEIIMGTPKDAEELLEKFEELYEGTSESYNPQLVNDDLGKRAAICLALKETVDSYVTEAKRLKQQEIDNNNTGVVAIGVAAAIVGLMGASLLFPPSAAAAASLYGAYFSAGTLAMASTLIGASATALGAFTEIVKRTSMPVLEDENAKEEILCAWFDALKDSADISHEAFKQTLDMSGASSNGQALYQVVKSLIDIDLAYPAFLERWATNITLGDAGAIYDECGCEEPTVTLQNLNGNYDDTIIQFIGYAAGDQEVWDMTLPDEDLNASDAIVVRGVTGVTLVNFYIKKVQVISGNVYQYNHGPTIYPSGYPDDVLFTTITMYTDQWPTKVRMWIDWDI